MLDVRLIRSEPDAVREALRRRGAQDAAAIETFLELDERWRAITAQLEDLRAEQNRASKGRAGAPTDAEREQLAALAAKGRELSEEETAVKAQRDAVLASLPNLPMPDAPLEDTVLSEHGRGRSHRPGPPRARRSDDRHGTGSSAVRLAVRLSPRRRS